MWILINHKVMLAFAFGIIFSACSVESLKECGSGDEYQRDIQDGCVEIAYFDGIKVETPLKNGKINGVARVYRESGEIALEILIENDEIINGKCSNGKELSKERLESVMGLENEFDFGICD